MSVLTCPKCTADMRSYERNGVTIDQCGGCRGVFLDRGELERLIDAESSFYDKGRPEPVVDPRPSPERKYEERKYDDRRSSEYDYKKKKKHSFLSELFD